jgi:hypothetical protein
MGATGSASVAKKKTSVSAGNMKRWVGESRRP